MRRFERSWLALVGSCLVLASIPVSAKSSGDRFELQSQLMARVPEVAAALEQVNAAPQDHAGWRALGQTLANLGDYDDAIRAFERAVRLDSKNPDIWVDLGAAYLRTDELSRGKSALRRALDLEPFHALAYYNLGLALQEDGRYEDALESFEKALLLDPKLGDPRSNAGAVNNPMLAIVKHRVYLRTAGAAPALFAPAAEATAGE